MNRRPSLPTRHRSALLALLVAGALVAVAPAVRAQPAPDAAPAPHPAAALVAETARLMRVDHEAGKRQADAALALLAQRPDADLEIQARIALCDYYTERDHAQALQQVERSTALLPRAARGGLRALVLKCEGEIHESAGRSREALALYERAVSAAEVSGDEPALAEALFQRGHMRGTLGEPALGLADLKRSHGLFGRAGMTDHANTVFNAIAILYNRMGDYAQARHFYEQTLRHHEALGSMREAVVTRYNLGRTLENLGLWDEARASYQQALQQARGISYARGEAYALRGLAAVGNATGNGQAALDRAREALQVLGGLPDARLRAQVDLQRGIALRLLKRPGESVPVLGDALQSFAEAGPQTELAAAHEALARAHADLGEWRSAHEQLRRFHELATAALRGQIDQRFATLKVEFDSAERERENALLLREKAAAEAMLEQQLRAGRLQYAVIALALLSTLLAALLALRHWRTSKRMQRLALTDELTGLANRRDVVARLGALLERPGAAAGAALIADLDHFKPINDEFGHLAGDEVLKLVAAALRESLREPALLGRLGGEEFLIVLPDTGLEAARAAGERLREAVERTDVARLLPGRRVTISVGIAAAQPGADTTGSVLRRADIALYEAKAGGRNCVRMFAEDAPPPRPVLAVVGGATV